MEHQWMRIIDEPSGDDPIGAALVRIARRAAAVHRFEAAKRAQCDAADRPSISAEADPAVCEEAHR